MSAQSQEVYRLTLYVAGGEPNSRLARENLDRLCRERLDGRCDVEVVDVARDFGRALEDDVVLTPTLRLLAPLPVVTVIGTLSDEERVLDALRLGRH